MKQAEVNIFETAQFKTPFFYFLFKEKQKECHLIKKLLTN